MLKDYNERGFSDWAIANEWDENYSGDRNIDLSGNILLYDVKSVIKTQNVGARITYAINWEEKGHIHTYRWRMSLYEENQDLGDLYDSFMTNGGKQSIDDVRLAVFWETIKKDLLNFFDDEPYDQYNDEANAEYAEKYGYKNDPENAADREFCTKHPPFTTCPVCSVRGPKDRLPGHIKRDHVGILGTQNVKDFLKLPIRILTEQELIDRKWLTVVDVMKGTNGNILGLTGKPYNITQYIERAFLLCKRCYYFGFNTGPGHYKIFEPPVTDDKVHLFVPPLMWCPQCNEKGCITTAKFPIQLFDFDLHDLNNPELKITVTRCDEWNITKGNLVVVDAEEIMEDVNRRQVKKLRHKRVQIISKDVAANALGTDIVQNALPEKSIIEYKIRKLLFAEYQAARTVMNVFTVLQKIYDNNLDIRTAEIFAKDYSSTRDNWPLRLFLEKLVVPMQDDNGKLKRIGKAHDYMWQNNELELPA